MDVWHTFEHLKYDQKTNAVNIFFLLLIELIIDSINRSCSIELRKFIHPVMSRSYGHLRSTQKSFIMWVVHDDETKMHVYPVRPWNCCLYSGASILLIGFIMAVVRTKMTSLSTNVEAEVPYADSIQKWMHKNESGEEFLPAAMPKKHSSSTSKVPRGVFVAHLVQRLRSCRPLQV